MFVGTMLLKPASAVSCLGPSGGPLSCLVAAAQPSQSAQDSLCLQEGGTCLVRRWYLQAGVSRLWNQERLPGGQAGLSGPLHSHSTPPTSAFFPHVHPSNALGHMGRCPRPAMQPLTLSLDYDLTPAPPSRWKSPASPRLCRAQLLVPSSPPGGAQPGVHGGWPTDCCSSRILPEWQCEGRSHFLLFFAGSPGL